MNLKKYSPERRFMADSLLKDIEEKLLADSFDDSKDYVLGYLTSMITTLAVSNDEVLKELLDTQKFLIEKRTEAA